MAEPRPGRRDPEPAERAKDAVRAVEAAYDAAWSRGDVEGVLGCLADDVVVVTPRDEVARGRDGVGAMLASLLGGEAQGTSHASRVVRVELVTDDVAVVDGVATLAGGGATTFVHRYTDVLRREPDGVWRIAHVRACPGRGPGADAR